MQTYKLHEKKRISTSYQCYSLEEVDQDGDEDVVNTINSVAVITDVIFRHIFGLFSSRRHILIGIATSTADSTIHATYSNKVDRFLKCEVFLPPSARHSLSMSTIYLMVFREVIFFLKEFLKDISFKKVLSARDVIQIIQVAYLIQIGTCCKLCAARKMMLKVFKITLISFLFLYENAVDIGSQSNINAIVSKVKVICARSPDRKSELKVILVIGTFNYDERVSEVDVPGGAININIVILSKTFSAQFFYLKVFAVRARKLDRDAASMRNGSSWVCRLISALRMSEGKSGAHQEGQHTR